MARTDFYCVRCHLHKRLDLLSDVKTLGGKEMCITCATTVKPKGVSTTKCAKRLKAKTCDHLASSMKKYLVT